jgi:hypothetical protein
MSVANRPWWNDEQLKSQLNSRIIDGNWFVRTPRSVGKVIQIIYAGYKIELPDNRVENINPEQCQVDDITPEEFKEQSAIWSIRNNEEQVKAAEMKANMLAHEQAIELKQSTCLHSATEEKEVLRGAGCDVSDTNCSVCLKVLRRSWSTAYDRDPKDHVSDWAWWLREHRRLYGTQAPNMTDYEIVDKIGFL